MEPILSDKQRMRLRNLQNRADAGESLTATEQATLEGLLRQVEASEVEYLQPANLRLKREYERLAQHNARLESLVLRKNYLPTICAEHLRKCEPSKKQSTKRYAAC